MAIPLKSSAAERTRPTLWDGLVALIIVLIAAALLAALLPGETGGRLTARITLDGTEIGVYDLATVAEGTLVEVDQTRWPMTLELSPTKGVRVKETACPHGDCAAAGWIDGPGEQIICLPNRLIVSLEGEEVPNDFDVVIG